MKIKTYTPLPLLAITALLAGSAQATIVTAYARNGGDVGSGSTNATNGAAWAEPTSSVFPHFPGKHEANAVGTVTTAAFVGSGNGPTPQTFSYHVTDTATSVDFTFDMTFTAFYEVTPGSSGYLTTNRRGSTIDSPTNNENRDSIEYLTAGGATEYVRTSLSNINILSGHTVTFTSWDQVSFSKVNAGLTGEIRESGGTNAPGTGASLFSFSSATTGVQTLAANSASSIDWVATADATAAGNGFGAKGFVVSFDVVAVPEPSSSALLGLGGLALILRRRR